MDGSNLSISALKSKVSLKLSSGKPADSSKKNNGRAKEEKTKTTGRPRTDEFESSPTGVKHRKSAKLEKKEKKENSKENSKPNTVEEKSINASKSRNRAREGSKVVDAVADEVDFQALGDGKGDENLNSDLSNFMDTLGFPGKGNTVQQVQKKHSESSKETKKPTQTEPNKFELRTQKQEKKKAKQKAADAVKASAPKVKVQESTVLVSELPKKKKKDIDSHDKVSNLSSVNSEKLLIECRIDWYNIETLPVGEPEKLDRFALERLTEKAKALVDLENKTYLSEFTSNNPQKKFLSQILSDGTLNDKISALTLLVQEAPFHNLKAFDTLLAHCEKKSRTASLQAINALKDLFMNGLLPDRKLMSFAKQTINKHVDAKTLAIYYFEDHLKRSYFKFIQVLELLSRDPILHVRMNIVLHIFDLLKAKPEQEANLLRLGVNKLGDTENKVAAKTCYQIIQLEEAHPAMKKIVTDAVTDLVLQKSHDYHSQYYTILTLNQTILVRGNTDLANSLVTTYFSLFEKILVESDPALKDKADDTILGKSERGRKNNRKSFKKGKKGGKSVKVEERSEDEVVKERSAKMFSALLTGLNRAFPFSDLPSETYLNHLNTLYKITHSTNFNTSVQALVLVYQIITLQDLDSARYYRTLYESLMDPRLANSSKQGIYLNLLFKSLKNDVRNIPRVLAFVKRILQICCHWINVGAITGMFYLLMELTKTHPQILELMEAEGARPEILTSSVKADATSDETYDSKKRDPVFANAQKSCLWEISLFVNHYHPSVAIYATSLIEGKPQAKPDLGLYSLAHFLDRFVYKIAKKKSNLKGSSIMQPLGGGHLGSLLVRATNVKSAEIPVNTSDWLSKKAELVRPDEKFFYNYFINNENKIRVQKSKDDEAEDFEEDEVWSALVKLKPDVEGAGDEGFSDYDEKDFADMSDLESNDNGTDNSDANLMGEEFDDFDDADHLEGDDDDDTSFGELQTDDDERSDGELEVSDDDGDSSMLEKGRKRKLTGDDKRKKKAKLLALPTFASAEEYAEYLQSDDEF